MPSAKASTSGESSQSPSLRSPSPESVPSQAGSRRGSQLAPLTIDETVIRPRVIDDVETSSADRTPTVAFGRSPELQTSADKTPTVALGRSSDLQTSAGDLHGTPRQPTRKLSLSRDKETTRTSAEGPSTRSHF
jgi:hypothetical protein